MAASFQPLKVIYRINKATTGINQYICGSPPPWEGFDADAAGEKSTAMRSVEAIDGYIEKMQKLRQAARDLPQPPEKAIKSTLTPA